MSPFLSHFSRSKSKAKIINKLGNLDAAERQSILEQIPVLFDGITDEEEKINLLKMLSTIPASKRKSVVQAITPYLIMIEEKGVRTKFLQRVTEIPDKDRTEERMLFCLRVCVNHSFSIVEGSYTIKLSRSEIKKMPLEILHELNLLFKEEKLQRLYIIFEGEKGIDSGGLSLEFLHELTLAVAEKMKFEKHKNGLYSTPTSTMTLTAEEKRVYQELAEVMSFCIDRKTKKEPRIGMVFDKNVFIALNQLVDHPFLFITLDELNDTEHFYELFQIYKSICGYPYLSCLAEYAECLHISDQSSEEVIVKAYNAVWDLPAIQKLNIDYKDPDKIRVHYAEIQTALKERLGYHLVHLIKFIGQSSDFDETTPRAVLYDAYDACAGVDEIKNLNINGDITLIKRHSKEIERVLKEQLQELNKESVVIMERAIIMANEEDVRNAFAAIEDEPEGKNIILGDVLKTKQMKAELKEAFKKYLLRTKIMPMLAPLLEMAKGMIESSFRRNVKRLLPDQLMRKVQGSVSKEEILSKIRFNRDLPKHFQGWVRSWLEKATQEQLQKFLVRMTSSDALGSQSLEFCLGTSMDISFHTCTAKLAIPKEMTEELLHKSIEDNIEAPLKFTQS